MSAIPIEPGDADPARAASADGAASMAGAERLPHSNALVLLAVLAVLLAMHWASAVFIPLLLGLTLSYALTPLAKRLVLWRVPRAAAAAALLLGLTGGVGWLAYSLSDQAAAMIETLPVAAQKLRRSFEGRHAPTTTIETVQKAAAEIERVADSGTPSSPPSRGVTKVQIEKSRFDIKDYLWPGALGLAALVGQAVVVLFVTFFLLASGDTFRRKMVKIAGPDFGPKRLTLEALDQIDAQIQRYLLVQVFTSALVGASTWLAFLWIGVDNAAVWGVVAFALNFIPYVGSMVVTGGAALLGLVQFGSLEMALLIGGVSMLIHGIEGGLLTPWLSGKASAMNPVAIFVGVLAWGWLLGIWGLFLGTPVLLAIKAVCDRVDELKAVGELLGE